MNEEYNNKERRVIQSEFVVKSELERRELIAMPFPR